MHLAKQIFKKLSTLLHITELQCYTLYLDNALDFRLDFRSLSSHVKTDIGLAKHFYGGIDEPPKFFNYKSCFDWARLNGNIMPKTECLCLYLEKPSKRGESTYIKIYDESTITRLFYPNESNQRICCDLLSLKMIFMFEKTLFYQIFFYFQPGQG